jgi:hypothetical protein
VCGRSVLAERFRAGLGTSNLRARGSLPFRAIELVRQAAREAAAAGELPTFLGALEAVRVEAILEAARPAIDP